MRGISVYFTPEERCALVSAATKYTEMMSDGEETFAVVQEELKDGLGSALCKLYKNCEGEKIYKKYKVKRGEQQ